jgi:hypothetical protein
VFKLGWVSSRFSSIFPMTVALVLREKWELLNRDNVLVDAFISHSLREKYCVHQIIGQKVCSFSINVPKSFTLNFENQFALTIYDDLEHYESFYIHSGSGCSTYI